jgi:ketosteroid isomerase-like protein
MSVSATPRQVFETRTSLIAAGRWEEIADLYAEDTVVETPFALPVPHRAEGREAVRAHFARSGSGAIEMQAENVRVRETTDPEVIVIECDYRGRFIPTGRTFDVPSVQILQVREGLIVSARDFTNHVVIAAAAGQLPAVLAALDPQPEPMTNPND